MLTRFHWLKNPKHKQGVAFFFCLLLTGTAMQLQAKQRHRLTMHAHAHAHALSTSAKIPAVYPSASVLPTPRRF